MMKRSERKHAEPIKIPLDFKQTILAALETPPEPQTMKKKKALRKLKQEISSQQLDAFLQEWLQTKNDPSLKPDDPYYQGASSFRAFLQNKLPQ
jgi:hypothetical protein